MRERGTSNWKLISNSGSYFLTNLGQPDLFCFSLLVHFIFLSLHVVFYHCTWLSKSSNLNSYIYSRFCDPVLNPGGKKSILRGMSKTLKSAMANETRISENISEPPLPFFFWLHLRHVEVPAPGIEPMPQQWLGHCCSDNTRSLACCAVRNSRSWPFEPGAVWQKELNLQRWYGVWYDWSEFYTIFKLINLFIYVFLGPYPQHMEVPRLGVE